MISLASPKTFHTSHLQALRVHAAISFPSWNPNATHIYEREHTHLSHFTCTISLNLFPFSPRSAPPPPNAAPPTPVPSSIVNLCAVCTYSLLSCAFEETRLGAAAAAAAAGAGFRAKQESEESRLLAFPGWSSPVVDVVSAAGAPASAAPCYKVIQQTTSPSPSQPMIPSLHVCPIHACMGEGLQREAEPQGRQRFFGSALSCRPTGFQTKL